MIITDKRNQVLLSIYFLKLGIFDEFIKILPFGYHINLPVD